MTTTVLTDCQYDGPSLVAFGNPLLDIIVRDDCTDIVEKYNLDKNIAQELDTITTGLHKEVTNKPVVEYTGGGCALNTVRVFQWLSTGKQNDSVFIGGLGDDKGGNVLETLVNNDGVSTSFARQSDLPTGHCIALVEGSERTLVANLGAANIFSKIDLWTEKNRNIFQSAKVIYVEGYFLAHSFEATMEMAKFAQENQVTFIFNLCGEYVCEDISYVKNVLQILPYIDIIFGNRSEFDVFIDTIEAKLEISSTVIQNLRTMITGEGVENLDMKIENICESPVKTKPKSLIAVVTEGCNPVQCYSIGERLKTVSVPVPSLPSNAVRDTIGAGDSFIAGFIFVFLRRGSLRSCIEYAIWTAQKMIQQVGVRLPSQKPEPPLLQFQEKKDLKQSASCSQDSSSCNISSDRPKIRS